MLNIILLGSCVGPSDAIRTVAVADVQAIRAHQNDTLYILNFWATWCQPCKEEIPYFEQVNEQYADSAVRLALISVDEAPTRHLYRFVQQWGLKSDVWWLDRGNQRDWIDDVHVDWQGNIPVTLFVYFPKRIIELHDKEISYPELVSKIQNIRSP